MLEKLNKEENDKRKYVLSKDLDLCEGCGEFKNVVVGIKSYVTVFDYILFPFKLVFILISFFIRLILLPYFIYKYIKENNGQ